MPLRDRVAGNDQAECPLRGRKHVDKETNRSQEADLFGRVINEGEAEK